MSVTDTVTYGSAGVHLMINEVIPDLPRIVLGVHWDNYRKLHKTKFGLLK